VCAGHWRGSKKGAGRVGGRRGREIRRRARVRTRRSRRARRGRNSQVGSTAQREEKGACGAMARRLADRARETEREREGARGEENWRRQAGLGCFLLFFSLNFLIPFPFPFL
jgi:hypothetical protein